MRCNPDGSNLELVAWGLRNAYGLGFLPDGRLLAVDQGADDRGSRPVGNVPDLLFEVRQGAWYGWPDFIDGDPITDPQYRPVRGPRPVFALANHHELPPPEKELLRFPSPRSSGQIRCCAIISTEVERTHFCGSFRRRSTHDRAFRPTCWALSGTHRSY